MDWQKCSDIRITYLASYALVFEPTTLQTVCMLAATVVLGYMLYFIVEKPFRSPKNAHLSGAGFSVSCAVLACIIGVPAANSWMNNGWEWRVPEEVRNVNKIDKSLTTEYTWKLQKELDTKPGFSGSGKPKMLVIGDSQSADFINTLTESVNLEKFDVVARTVISDCSAPYISDKGSDDYFAKVNKKTSSKPD